jgi:KAP family P-loop domain
VKTTVLRLVERGLRERNLGPERQILVVATDPWRYDPSVGAKETLIGEILGAIKAKLAEQNSETATSKAVMLVKKLAKRVQWAKSMKLAARTALTLQLPNPEDLTSLIAEPEDEDQPRGLDQFRADFEELMESEELGGVERLVVLVDDLDRCLPETVIETLETMRLFLAVPKMAFVIAADEDRVAAALRGRFPDSHRTPEDDAGLPLEEPASLYLHKIVQTTVPIPALSRFDTQAYLVLLQLSHGCEPADLEPYIRRCDELRRAGKLLDDLGGVSKDRDIATEMAFAARLTPLFVREAAGQPPPDQTFPQRPACASVGRRAPGIELEPDVVAKLMVLEKPIQDGLKTVLDWLAKGELREQVRSLEKAADRPDAVQDADDTKATATASGNARPPRKDQPKRPEQPRQQPKFDDDLLRWGKLPPALGALDVAPYLHLAASFSGRQVLDNVICAHSPCNAQQPGASAGPACVLRQRPKRSQVCLRGEIIGAIPVNQGRREPPHLRLGRAHERCRRSGVAVARPQRPLRRRIDDAALVTVAAHGVRPSGNGQAEQVVGRYAERHHGQCLASAQMPGVEPAGCPPARAAQARPMPVLPKNCSRSPAVSSASTHEYEFQPSIRNWSSSGLPITSRIVSLADRTARCEFRRICRPTCSASARS